MYSQSPSEAAAATIVMTSGARQPGSGMVGWKVDQVACQRTFAIIQRANAIIAIKARRRDASMSRSSGISRFLDRAEEISPGVLCSGPIRIGDDIASRVVLLCPH